MDLLLGGQDHLAQHGVDRKLSHPATKLKVTEKKNCNETIKIKLVFHFPQWNSSMEACSEFKPW